MRLDTNANCCFVCGPGNAQGLGVRFRLEDDRCLGEYVTESPYRGYDGVTHGGIVFCLLDDVMANYLFLKGERVFTARADIRYRAPLPIGTAVRLEGWRERRRARLVEMSGRVLGRDDGQVYAEATGKFMVQEGA